MIYYKKINLDCTVVTKKTLAYANAHRGAIKTFWTNINFNDFVQHVPEIFDLFAPMNITPNRVSLISVFAPLSNEGIHIDHTDSAVRINLPILNCEFSETRFWKSEAKPNVVMLPNMVPYYYFNSEDCTLVDSVVLDMPTALRVHEPHSVYVAEKFPRLSLTVDFNENIEYLLNDDKEAV